MSGGAAASEGAAAGPRARGTDWAAVEAKWRARWEERRAHEADADPSRPKRFVTVAYPYPNSPQHVGHGRTYTIADAHARYLRMRGYNVLFPMGFHYTGTPILGMARRVQDGDAELLEGLRGLYGVPDEAVRTFADPVSIARYFHEEIRAGMVEMGYSIDWRREFTTIDPAYKRFVEWQIATLRGMGLIVQGSHPVGWCPKDNNPVSQHDTLGDVEPDFTEYTLVKFRLDGDGGGEGGPVIPVATLRPETLFGATNLWVDPGAEYVRAAVSDPSGPRAEGEEEAEADEWIVSAECARKLEFLGKKVEPRGTVRGSDLVGRTAAPPGGYTGAAGLPVLPARFVRQGTGTGLVMSVPAHAPYDWRALEDLREAGGAGAPAAAAAAAAAAPPKIIESDGFAGADCPAADACRRLGVRSQDDAALLEKATDEVYGKEFYGGSMMDNSSGGGDGGAVPARFAGMKVPEARDAVREWLTRGAEAQGAGGYAASEPFLEITGGPVRCRCGAECVVRMLSDQWFLDYGSAAWKKNAHECLSRMSILPKEIRGEFGNVVDWLRERACARQHGLGTSLPWDDGWIVESLSDSVIYMAFYTISGMVRSGALRAEHLTPAFFDYAFLGMGGRGAAGRIARETGADEAAVRRARAEFAYFYPVDARHSGRDLVPNHLTFFVMNHTAVFGRDSWPRGIVVNGSVLMDGKKMSKSMGNIIPLRRAVREHGADAIRLAILVSAELLQDADFSADAVSGVKSRLEAMMAECGRLGSAAAAGYAGGGGPGAEAAAEPAARRAEDRWLLSRTRDLVAAVTTSVEAMRLREALHAVLFGFESDLQWHRKRAAAAAAAAAAGGKGGEGGSGSGSDAVLREVYAIRVRLLSPFAPHAADEMWERLGMGGPASSASGSRWPEDPREWDDPAAIQAEDLLGRVVADVGRIVRVAKMGAPRRITAYVASGLKARAYESITRAVSGAAGAEAEGEYAGKRPGAPGEAGARKGGGRQGPGMAAVMKALIADPGTAGIKADPGFVQRAIKDALSEPARIKEARLRAGHVDERAVLESELGALAAAEFGRDVQVRVLSEDGEDDPAGKARRARPLRPALHIE